MDCRTDHGRSMKRIGAAECVHCPVRERGLLGQADANGMLAIRANVDILRFPARTRIYAEKSAGEYVYSIRSGLVKLEQQSGDGRARIVRLATPGTTLGLELLFGTSYRHTALVLHSTDLCRIPVRLLRTLRDDQKELCDSLLRHMQQNIDAAGFEITQLSTGTAQARIARLLLHLSVDNATDARQWIMREDIAALLGVTLETVSRTISDMKRRGLISEEQHYFVFDRPELERIANC